eukprot:GEZU01023902.1.p1 GENE.GEZU01023902.1~~GEZU01023902.1.p1  ORF type:complete len:821 (+),score=158.33 GEZU01023902.1:1808-4270(+)
MKETKDKYQMERSSDFNCVENSIRLLSNFPMLYTLSNGENMLQRIVEVCLFHRIISYESLQKLLSPQVYASLLSSSKVIADWPNMEGESTPVLSTDNIESAFDPKANRMWTDADVDIYNQWVNKEGVGLDELRRLIEETCATLLGTQFFVQTHLLDLIVEDFFSAPRYTEKLEFLLSGILNNPSVLDIFHLHGEIHHIIKLLLKMARQYLLDADSKQKNGYSGLDDAGVLKSHRQFGYIFSVLYLIIHRFEVLHNDTNQRVFIEDLNNASKELGDTKTSSFALLLEWFYEEYIHRSASATQQQPTDRHKEIGVDLISVLYKAYCDKASDLPVSSSSITADKIDLQSNVLASVLRKYTPTEILGATPYIVRQCFAAYFESKLTDQGTLLSMLASLCTECGKHVELCVVKTLCSYQKYEFNKEAASESERVLFLLFAVLQRHEPQQRVTNHLTASMLGALLRSDSPAATEHRGLIQSSESLLSRKPASLLPAIKNKGSAAHRALTSIRLVFSHNFGQFLNPHAHPSLFTSYMLTHSLISLKEVFVLIGQEQFIELVLQEIGKVARTEDNNPFECFRAAELGGCVLASCGGKSVVSLLLTKILPSRIPTMVTSPTDAHLLAHFAIHASIYSLLYSEEDEDDHVHQIAQRTFDEFFSYLTRLMHYCIRVSPHPALYFAQRFIEKAACIPSFISRASQHAIEIARLLGEEQKWSSGTLVLPPSSRTSSQFGFASGTGAGTLVGEPSYAAMAASSSDTTHRGGSGLCNSSGNYGVINGGSLFDLRKREGRKDLLRFMCSGAAAAAASSSSSSASSKTADSKKRKRL